MNATQVKQALTRYCKETYPDSRIDITVREIEGDGCTTVYSRHGDTTVFSKHGGIATVSVHPEAYGVGNRYTARLPAAEDETYPNRYGGL